MMTVLSLQILLISCLVSVMCVLPGTFLVLRGVALMSDAISHAILPGIVIMFLIIGKLDSPLLLVGAVIAGIATVIISELLMNTNRLKKDAAIGLVFPFFFSIGVILISLYTRTVHLDIDMVILGELVFAPFNRLVVAGIDLGPYAFWSTGCIIMVNALLIKLFFKELTISIFDQHLAYLFGFGPTALYYILMIITSITTVVAFDIVGSFVVVALMITPPATASLITHRVQPLLMCSILIAVLSACGGYSIATFFDVSITGCIASSNGILFVIALLCAPQKGLIVKIVQRWRLKKQIAQELVCWYIHKHSHTSEQQHMSYQLGWPTQYTQQVIKHAINNGLLTENNKTLLLTSKGLHHLSQSSLNYQIS